MAHAPAVHDPPVPAGAIVEVALGIPAAQAHRFLQRLLDGSVQGLPALRDDIAGLPPEMDLSPEENILQVAVADSPDAWGVYEIFLPLIFQSHSIVSGLLKPETWCFCLNVNPNAILKNCNFMFQEFTRAN